MLIGPLTDETESQVKKFSFVQGVVSNDDGDEQGAFMEITFKDDTRMDIWLTPIELENLQTVLNNFCKGNSELFD